MDRRKVILEALELESLLESEFSDEIVVMDRKKNYRKELYGTFYGVAWYIAKGWVKGTTYFGSGAEMKWDLKGGNWLGFEDSIVGSKLLYDLEAMSDCVILEIPLRKIYRSPNTDAEVLRGLMWHLAMSKKYLEDIIMERIGLSDEGFFLKYLENNEFNITFRSQQDISDVLAITIRTFQRIVKSLEEEGVISVRRGSIKVTDKDRFYSYIEANGIWDSK